MALPSNRLSSVPVVGAFLPPHDQEKDPLVGQDRGGVAVADTSQGFSFQNWTAVREGTGFRLTGEDNAATFLFEAGLTGDVTEIDLAFDSAGEPVVSFVQDEDSFLRFFDSAVNAFVNLTIDGVTPRVTLDDARPQANTFNDVICVYLRGTQLCVRNIRERFMVEYVLGNSPSWIGVDKIGMGDNGRVHIRMLR